MSTVINTEKRTAVSEQSSPPAACENSTTDAETNADPPFPISDFLWFHSLQELPKENSKFNTVAKHFPKIWNMMTIVFKYWKEEVKWYKPSKATNPTDFKRQVVEYILGERKIVRRSEIPSKYLQTLRPEKDDCTKGAYYYLSKDIFLEHCEILYKHDKADKDHKEKHCVNDILRLFSIATDQHNRDDLLKISKGKAYVRSDLDGPLSMFDSVMQRWSLQFNDPNKRYTTPFRAIHLSTFEDMDPNDPERINISRDYVWLGKLYKRVMKEYDPAWKRWTKGTGGGSGMPEDFHCWEERENLEEFANYADNRSVECLAYILMLDKKAEYILNTINEPVREDTVMEDGGVSNGGDGGCSKRRRTTAADRIAATTKEITDNMNKSMQGTLDTVKKLFSGMGDRGNSKDVVGGMDRCMKVIRSIEMQMKVVRDKIVKGDSSEEGTKMKKCLDMLQTAHNTAFDEFGKYTSK